MDTTAAEPPAREPQVCPYLGLHHDPDTYALTPSLRHYCHHSRPVARLARHTQEQYCLQRFRSCPVYARSELAPLPPDMRASRSHMRWLRLSTAQVLIILLVFLGMVALGLYFLR